MNAHRVSSQQLGALGAHLSERDRQVLASVAAHRFLTTRHIQTLHFADHATQATGARATREVLTRLHSLNILARLDRRVGGVRAGSAAFVWTVGPVGDRLLRADSGNGVRHRFQEPSLTFLEHTLAVADTHLALIAASRARRLELLEVDLEPACWRPFTGPGGAPLSLRPDLYVVTGDGQYEHCWFLEVDRATESVPHVLRACRSYQAYRATGIEQAKTGTFPVVMWLAPHQARLHKMTAALREAALDQSQFRVALVPDLVELLGGEPS
jgi:hypothetical protein